MTDTGLLDRAGWKFFAEEHENHMLRCWQIRLAATAPDTSITISGVLNIRREQFLQPYPTLEESFIQRGIEMQQYTTKDVFRCVHPKEITSWQKMEQVDLSVPSCYSERQIYMRDFKVFQPMNLLAPEKEIYIPEESIDDLFSRILQLQYPQQQEIKKGLIMPEKKPIIQARIFSLVA